MEKYAWKATVKEGCLEEYKRRHNEIWDEMIKVLKKAGICNYTIWNVGNELFGYYECEKGLKFAADYQANSHVVDKWNEYMKDVMVHEMSAFEDFNPNIKSNFRAEDHNRRWYHTDTAHPTLPDPEFAEQIHDNNPNPEDIALSNIALEEYWKTLDPKDRIIIKMLMAGFTQKQAAVEVGIANNGGVSKRLSKICKDITKKTGIKI